MKTFLTFHFNAVQHSGQWLRGSLFLIWLLIVQSVCAGVAPGTGMVGQPWPTGGSGCQSCGSGITAAQPPGFYFSINAGSANLGGSAGDFYAFSTMPDAALATPSELFFSGAAGTNSGVQIVTNLSGTVLQVVAPQIFATVTTNSPYAYQIKFYSTNALGTWNGSNYNIINGATNLVTSWQIANPDGSTNFNRVQISEMPGGVTNVWLLAYNFTSGVWTNDLPGGLVEQRMSQIYDNITQTRTEDVQWAVPSGAAVYQHTKVYTNFSWGQALISDTLGNGAATQATYYTYYPDTSSAGYAASSSQAPIKSLTRADGSWQYFPGYDTNGRPTSLLSGIDGALTTNLNNCRSVQYYYTPVDPSDDGTLFWNTARKEVENFKNTVVAVTYRIYQPGKYQIIRCISPTAVYTDAANLVTTTLYFTNGINNGSVQSVRNPDGTMVIYDYGINAAGTQQTNIVSSGQPNSGGTAIVDGTKTITITGPVNQILTQTSVDIASANTIMTNNYAYLDTYQRSYTVTHLDHTTETFNYACCGLDNTIDQDGAATTYLYDAMKRPYGYAKYYGSGNPIIYQNTLDAAGNILKSVRIGTNSTSITLNQSQYDTAGQLIIQTNSLNGVSIYARTNDATTGGLIQTLIYPNLGTVTNIFNPDGTLNKTVGTSVHGMRYQYGTGTANGSACTYVEEIKLNSTGSDSSETTTTYSDMVGRSAEILYADGSKSVSFYNLQGQLTNTVDPDGVSTMYAYNGKGEQAFTTLDISHNYQVFGSLNRITQTTNYVTSDINGVVRRALTYEWLDGQSSGTLVSSNESTADRLTTWQTQYRDVATPVTAQSLTLIGTTRVTSVYAPDGSYNSSTYSYGRLAANARHDSSGTILVSGTTFAYDSQGRQYQTTDARNGTTTYGYNNADLITSVTTPNPGGVGGSAQVTANYYNNMLQLTNVVQPDGTSVASTYLLTGELGLQSGSRTYPVGYSYDYAGRMQMMTNWSGFPSTGARVTTWKYDGYRGFLTNKVYDGGIVGPAYTYTAAGRLQTRKWARNITTTYVYDNAGSVANVSYSDATPGTTNTYDRLGRLISIGCNGITDTLAYNLANEPLSELFSGGVLGGLSVTNGYDAVLRRTNLVSLNGTSALATASYGYDTASRLATVSDGTDNATYNYVANSRLVSQIIFRQGSTTRMTTTKSYDNLNRLTTIASVASNTASFNYNYNTANQRVGDALADGSYWVYTYDALGQVTGGNKFWADGTPVAGQQFDYTFDTIGNRTQTLSGGDQNGGFLRSANYYANNLNQLTNRDVPGYVDVKGVSFATNTVAVNGLTAYRKSEYFRDELAVNNSSAPLWTNLITTATGQASVTGNVYVAQQPEAFKYDADGNLTNDGRFTYSWDGENRLTNLTSLTGAPLGSQVKLDFAYDAKSRRIQKIVSTNNGTAYVPISTNRFLYDGWNLIAEVKPNNSLMRSYMWGTDLSGSQQSAGGVGGLLEVNYYGSSTTNSFPAFDGNGNVGLLVNAADGTTVASYEYGPFGEAVRATGPLARNNSFRFSTKYDDDESDLFYYGYRYYKPSSGAWSNRDPLDESGGANLYEFVSNDGIDRIDPNGLSALSFTSDGEYYFDGHIFGYSSSASASGKQNSSSAYFSQSASENYCPGGLCNSGGTGASSSFVTASVKNISCPVTCTCNVKWDGSTTVFSRHNQAGFSAHITILGRRFLHQIRPINTSDGNSPIPSWVASAAGSDSFTATIGAGTTELYTGYIVIAVPPNTPGYPGNGFSAAMSGSCSCK